MKTFSHLYQYVTEFFLDWEIFQIKFVEKIEEYTLCSVIFFPKIVPFFKYGKITWSQRGRRCNKAHGRYMLDKYVTRAQAQSHALEHPHTHTHPNTHMHALTHAFTQKHVILIAFPR